MKAPIDAQRLWLHVQHTPIAVIEWDRFCHVTVWNPAAAKMFGYSREEALEANIMDLLLPGYNRQEIEKVVKDLLSYRGGTRSTNENKTKDGRIIICEWYNTPLLDAQGEVMGVTSLVQDVTEQRRLEQERLKTARLESIGLLAGGIAHDFNNILTAVLGNINLARQQAQAAPELLEKAEQACQQGARLARQLLIFAKGGAPVRQICSLENLLRESVSFCLHGSKITTDFEIAPDLWWAEVDPGQMTQAIQNLVINADNAMAEGGRLWVRAENVGEGQQDTALKSGRYVKVTLRDEGRGIPDEHLPKIFDPYFTTKPGGSGLGLSTAYSVIKRHGGDIFVESETDQGTLFTLYVPAVPVPDAGNPPQEEREFDFAANPLRVLYMDDEKLLRNLFQHFARILHLEICCAAEGSEAVDIYQKALRDGCPFDVVVLDLTVPGGMGGLATLQELKKIYPQIRAVVTSGYSEDPVMATPAEYGFCGVLPKPFTLQSLKTVLAGVQRLQ